MFYAMLLLDIRFMIDSLELNFRLFQSMWEGKQIKKDRKGRSANDEKTGKWTRVPFEVTDEGVRVCESLRTAHERTEEVGRTLASMRDEGLIVGWRDELYPVVESFDEVSRSR